MNQLIAEGFKSSCDTPVALLRPDKATAFGKLRLEDCRFYDCIP